MARAPRQLRHNDAMANLTLAIDDDLLQQAREVALRDKTSVNAVVREFLHRYVDRRGRRLEALNRLEALASGLDCASSESWSRESLHEQS
ncbi:hypothetical protein [Synechococcus sp. BMK-MC-1]|uniref:hypothetical protein n=1 Tax=Synechococcus sp. BMK-MC-1 TaxID=1442551 RepID=UPI001645AE70|nr:hypothetical protein [Synechococcus sp. BMK-MC-1]